MPATRPDAAALLDGKLSVPSELRTAEWSMLPQWLRERVFYMAAVHRAEILEAFRAEVAAIASGERGLEESRRRLEDMLSAQGYQPQPGQEGTIKDLRSMRRIQTSLRTNVTLLQGWGQKNRGLTPGALKAFPGWELVRFEGRKHPRLWQLRFRRAGGTISKGGRMIAHKLSPIWHELGNGEKDSIGVDYPPFAWGSGMGWKQVPLAEMDALGLMADFTAKTQAPPISSPNESLQIVPAVATRAIRDALTERLAGLAEWKKDVLVFTDPNGTRPYSPEKLAAVWNLKMPPVFHDLPGEGQMQRDALIRWTGDHEQFRDAGNTDAWFDLLRVAKRIISQPVDMLWRGLTMSTEKLSGWLFDLESAGYAARLSLPLESWTISESAAATYANTGGRGWSIILSVENPRAAADISPIVRAFAQDIAKHSNPPVVTESEWVYTAGRQFKVLKIDKDTKSHTVRIQLEEMP